jgi:hypothetical protein
MSLIESMLDLGVRYIQAPNSYFKALSEFVVPGVLDIHQTTLPKNNVVPPISTTIAPE